MCVRLPLGVHSSRVESGAGETVPGAVRVSGQATVGTLGAVEVTLVQPDLGHAHFRAHVQLLLWETIVHTQGEGEEGRQS